MVVWRKTWKLWTAAVGQENKAMAYFLSWYAAPTVNKQIPIDVIKAERRSISHANHSLRASVQQGCCVLCWWCCSTTNSLCSSSWEFIETGVKVFKTCEWGKLVWGWGVMALISVLNNVAGNRGSLRHFPWSQGIIFAILSVEYTYSS